MLAVAEVAEVEPNDTIAQAQLLHSDEVNVRSSFHSSSDVDVYGLTLAPGDRLFADFSGGDGSTLFRITLYRPSGEHVINQGPTNPGMIEFYFDDIDEPGVWFVAFHIDQDPPPPERSFPMRTGAGFWIEHSDIVAAPLTVELGASANDDVLIVSYQVAWPEDKTFSVRLYWARETIVLNDDGTTSRTLDPLDDALSSPLEDTTAMEGLRHTPVPLATLRSKPTLATHLLLKVDAGATFDGSGDILEANESNNTSSRDVRFDIDPVELDWNFNEGGADLTYKIEPVANRFWAPENIPVDFFWFTSLNPNSAAPHATAVTFHADRSLTKLHVSPDSFGLPPVESKGLLARMDYVPDDFDGLIEETNEGNNYDFQSHERLTPDVLFISPGVAQRKNPYDVKVVVKNQAAIRINYELDWFENVDPSLEPGFVRENITNGPPADREFEDHRVTLGFAEDATISLPSLDGKGLFDRTWDWIPARSEILEALKSVAESVGKDSLKSIAEELARGFTRLPVGQLISALYTLKSIRDAYKDPSPKVDEVEIDYVVNAKALLDDAAPVSREEHVTLIVPQARKDDLAKFKNAIASLKVSSHLGFDILKRQGGSGEAIKQAAKPIVDALAAYAAAQRFYDNALDPPDPNYQVIFAPRPSIRFPFADAESDLLLVQTQRSLELLGLNEALTISRDRSLGAQADGEDFWEAEQLFAVSDFARQTSIAYSQYVAGQSLVEVWARESLAPITAETRDFYRANGPPPELVALLSQMGLSPEDIDVFVSLFLDDDENVLEEPGALTIPPRTSAILAAATAVDELAAAIGVKVERLSAPVMQLTASELAAINSTETTIGELIEHGWPTVAAFDAVVDYIDTLTAVAKSTNNIVALRPHLEFAYGALLSLQHFGVAPLNVVSRITALESEGEISPATSEIIQNLLSSGHAQLATGEFADYEATISAIAEYVELNRGVAISEAAANTILGFAELSSNLFINESGAAPTVVIGDAPLTSDEGTPIDLTSTVSDFNVGDAVTLSWTATKNGDPFATGGNAGFSFTPDDNGTYVVTLVATDSQGASAQDSATIEVVNVAPKVTIAAPSFTPRGETVLFSFRAEDPSSIDAAAPMTYSIDWNGDGVVDESLVGPAEGIHVEHTFPSGSFVTRVTATDKNGDTGAVATHQIASRATGLAGSVLYVVGTPRNDQVLVDGGPVGTVVATMNGQPLGPYFGVRRIVAYGLGGDDMISTASLLLPPAEFHGGSGNDKLFGTYRGDLLFGDDGNDTILGLSGNDRIEGGLGDDVVYGGNGHDIIDGGDGNDRLTGGSGNDLLRGGIGRNRLNDNLGNDILIGGDGADRLIDLAGANVLIGGLGVDYLSGGGAQSGNILIGGRTAHDDTDAALYALLAEWASGHPLTTRLSNLLQGGGSNGGYLLTHGGTVRDDRRADSLFGGLLADWFFQMPLDQLLQVGGNDAVTRSP